MYSLKKPPVGIYEKAFPAYFTWEEKFSALKAAGFDYMELSIDESDERQKRLSWSAEEIARLKERMERYDILFPTLCLSAHRRYPFGSRDPAVRQRAHEIMEKAIVLAVKLGVRCIQLAAYDVYYEDSDDETKEWYLSGMRDAVQMAEKAGVILAMEIMDTPFVGTILRAMHYIREIPSPYFKIYPDIGNLSQHSADVESELELGISQIVAVHIKETCPGVFRDVPFGEGNVRFTDIFRKLWELHYSGLFLVEMWADNGKRLSVEEAASSVRAAREFVLDKMRKAGYRV